MAKIRLWIDDLRPAPPGWHWAKTSQEALDVLISEEYEVEAVSFDHDLGEEDTSRRVALWMAEFESFPPVVYIHTANPVGRDWLAGIVSHYGGIRPIIRNAKDIK